MSAENLLLLRTDCLVRMKLSVVDLASDEIGATKWNKLVATVVTLNSRYWRVVNSWLAVNETAAPTYNVPTANAKYGTQHKPPQCDGWTMPSGTNNKVPTTSSRQVRTNVYVYRMWVYRVP